MKKNICFIFAVLFLLFAAPPTAVSAAAGGELAVDQQNVTITLKKPQEEIYAVNALRFRMYVTVNAGSAAQPDFRFAGNESDGAIRDVSISSVGDGRYLVDVILSGKSGWDVFQNGGQAVIGTLSLYPTAGQPLDAVVEIAQEATADGMQPAMRYVSSVGQSVQIVPVADVQPVKIKDTSGSSDTPSEPSTNPGTSDSSNTQVPGTPVSPGVPSIPVTPPGNSGTPVAPGMPENPGAAVPEVPGTTDTPAGTTDSSSDGIKFSDKAAPQLKVSVKNGVRRIRFEWNQVSGADGYQIYEYQEDTGKYKRLKTVFQAQATGYSRKMEYGTSYTFKLRAFQTMEDGSRINGAFSQAVRITTSPAKVKGLSAKKQAAGIRLTWKQAEKADGYQIYQSLAENGKYTRIKTVKKGNVHKYVDGRQIYGKVYYKVRAYVVGADGKRKYGNFSSIKKAR